MSFFAKLGSSGSESEESGSESEESILSGDEGEEQDLKLAQTKPKAKYYASMFVKEAGSVAEENESESSLEDEEEDLSGDSAADRQVGIVGKREIQS